MTPSEVLDLAATLIERDGWCRLKPTEQGARCISQAITVAGHGDPFASTFARQQLRAHLGLDQFYWLPRWNDEKGRTKREVVRALRGAAKR